ncbi:hypothetical protein V2J09_023376 [Rumex salicifolius]
MKRSLDENCAPVKRLFASSCGESHGQPQNSGGGNGGPRLTTDDALHYLKQVKEMFQNQREKYDQFLDVMKDFKAQRLNTEGVIGKVKELFKGHNHLIYGFNTFLPKGYEITLDDEEKVPKKVEFQEAINFVNKIKTRFEDDLVYKSFLHILNMYREGHKDIREIYEEVSQLFKDHPDLLDEFTRFLPDTSAPASGQNAQHGRSSCHRYDDRSTQIPSRQALLDKQRWQQDRVCTSRSDRDLSVERPDVDEERAMLKVNKDQRKREKDSRDRRNRDSDDREPEHDSMRNSTGQRFSEKRKPSRKEGFPMLPSSDKNSVKSMYNQEFTFCERVKEKLGKSDDYQAFLKCLHIYSTEIISRAELQGLVADLLGKYPDLMEGFNEFLERCENIDGFLAGVMRKKSLWTDGHLPRSMKIDEKDKDAKRETEIAKEKKEKYWKSIQDLDLSNCQRCTPSYRLLPDDYPIYTASHRSELGANVLNDHWVSVTSGSEDYSFKHMRRNQYEESLFKCEDDRFELDMLLESVNSTAKRAEDLLTNIRNNKTNIESSISIEDQFTALNMRCIERLYGDHGLDVTDLMRKNPASALPVLLIRLKQKQQEWTKSRSDLNKVWAEVYAKNHYKSLDHRSFYFKQQDSKNLSTKSLVAEIKEKKESIQKDDSLFFSVAAAYKRPLMSHIELHYPDNSVHEDVCSSKEQLLKVMRFWSTFLEKILGVPCQTSAGNGHTSVKGLGSLESHKTPRDDALSSAQCARESDIVGTIEVPVLSISSHMELSSGTLPSSVQGPTNTSGDINDDPKPIFDVRQPKDVIISNTIAARTDIHPEGSEIKQCQEESSGHLKFEKEEGELSPSGDFEEDNSAVCADTVMLAPEEKPSTDCQPCQNGNEEAAILENDAGAGEEDNENASEACGDASGSESIDDECSREDNEDEDDVDNDDLDDKAESESEVDIHYNKVKPLMKYVSSATEDAGRKDSRIFYGNDDFYVLFRLHQILYERILTAKRSSKSSEAKWKNSKHSNSSDPYARFLSALFNLLDGSSDNAKFEDDCRAIIGNQAYVLFTLDKLIYKLVKQLQSIIADEIDNKLLQLFEYEKSRKPGEFVDSVYHDNACVLLHDENLYRIECSSTPVRLSIQLMDSVYEKADMIAVSMEPKFLSYVDNDLLSLVPNKKEPNRILLRRNKRKYAGLDECSAITLATKGVQHLNGLEYKIRCRTSKMYYVLDTEDYFFRSSKRMRKSPSEQLAKPNPSRHEDGKALISSSSVKLKGHQQFKNQQSLKNPYIVA